MIELDSPVWNTVRTSPGGNGSLVATLLRQFSDGDESAFGELYNQVCHQNTVGEVAYLAVPHMVSIARDVSPHRRALLLCIVGSVVASIHGYPGSASPLREEWRSEFMSATEDARSLAAETLRNGDLSSEDSLLLIGALAALHKHYNLSLLLERGPHLSCPSCGEKFEYGERE